MQENGQLYLPYSPSPQSVGFILIRGAATLLDGFPAITSVFPSACFSLQQ